MPEPRDAPRSKLDFLYQDVLGEVTTLVERLETVSAQLHDVAKSRVGEVTAEALARAANASAARARTDFERSAENAKRELSEVVGEAARAVRELQEARWRDWVLWAAIYFTSSMVGGSVGALIIKMP